MIHTPTIDYVAEKLANEYGCRKAEYIVRTLATRERLRIMGAGKSAGGLVTPERPATWRHVRLISALMALGTKLTTWASPRQDEFDPRKDAFASVMLFVAIVLVMVGVTS